MWQDGGDSVAICGKFRSFDPVPVPEWPEIFFFNDDQGRPLLDSDVCPCRISTHSQFLPVCSQLGSEPLIVVSALSLSPQLHVIHTLT